MIILPLMIKWHQTLFHLGIGVLLIISQAGLLINAHYCQGEAKKAAFFVDPGSCHSDASANSPASCPLHGHDESQDPEHNGCCHDQSIFQKIVIDQLVFTQDLPVWSAAMATRPNSSLDLCLPFFCTIPPFLHPPPRQRTNLTILFQVFRL